MAYDPSQPSSSRTFLQRLGIYLAGVAIGLMTLGYFAAKRQQAAARLQPVASATAPAGGPWTPESVAETRVRGERIARAIERYRADRSGQLPPGLEALTPGYLDRIPGPTAGDSPWRYVTSEDGSFYYLSFGMNLGERYDAPRTGHLDARENVWRIVDEGGVERVEPLAREGAAGSEG